MRPSSRRRACRAAYCSTLESCTLSENLEGFVVKEKLTRYSFPGLDGTPQRIDPRFARTFTRRDHSRPLLRHPYRPDEVILVDEFLHEDRLRMGGVPEGCRGGLVRVPVGVGGA